MSVFRATSCWIQALPSLGGIELPGMVKQVTSDPEYADNCPLILQREQPDQQSRSSRVKSFTNRTYASLSVPADFHGTAEQFWFNLQKSA